jgi:succinoglycan biosynthesis protein ExoA
MAKGKPTTPGNEPTAVPGLTVSIVVPARNERRALPALIESIERQTVAPMEVVIADGMSDDGTRSWIAEAQLTRPWLKMVDNPKRIVPAAMNAAIEAAAGDLVCRMDAHATFADNYVEVIKRVFEDHPEVVAAGGGMESKGRTPWGHAIASVLSRPFGLGGASHRVGGSSGPVDHTFSPTYRRASIVAIGGFDERFEANEDFEVDRRLQVNGGVVWLEASTSSVWFVRDTPKKLAIQMYRYGFFKALTLWLHPGSIRSRQLAPPGVIVFLLSLLGFKPKLGALATASYLGAAGALGARAAKADGTSALKAAVATPVVHLSWGAGLLVGLVRHAKARKAAPRLGFERRK